MLKEWVWVLDDNWRSEWVQHPYPPDPSSTGTQQTIRGTPVGLRCWDPPSSQIHDLTDHTLFVKALGRLGPLMYLHTMGGNRDAIVSCVSNARDPSKSRARSLQCDNIQRLESLGIADPWWKISTTCIQCGLVQWMKPSSLGQPLVSMHTQKV